MTNINMPKRPDIEVGKDGRVLCPVCNQRVPLDDFNRYYNACLKCLNKKRKNW